MVALALGLRVYHVVAPGVMSVTQYDDGVYFGSALRLVQGVLPYRGYAFVQPPGITVLMSPVAALHVVIGTAWAMVVGRFLTALAGAAGVLLAGLLVRHRGPVAVLVAAGLAAVFPASVSAAHTVMLEPWLVLFSLGGALAVFDGDRLTASTSRLIWGGVLFGVAGAVKSWAIAPVFVVFLLCLPVWRNAARFVLGVAVGFLALILPFVLPAPVQFYNDVIAAQLGRVSHRVPVSARVQDMLGFSQIRPLTSAALPAAVIVVAALLIGAYLVAPRISGRPVSTLEWFAVGSCAAVAAMFLWPPYFSAHYAAFFAPFLALAVALPLTRPRQPGAERAGTLRDLRADLRRASAVLAVSVFGLVLALNSGAVSAHGPSALAIRKLVPIGSCVLSDQASYLILADRFYSASPSCSKMVDGLGTDLALSGGHDPLSGAGRFRSVMQVWRQAFHSAQYVLLSHKESLRIPWIPSLVGYFHHNFTIVLKRLSYSLYRRRFAPK
jgi:alpha-1,2-mannosyltransferase